MKLEDATGFLQWFEAEPILLIPVCLLHRYQAFSVVYLRTVSIYILIFHLNNLFESLIKWFYVLLFPSFVRGSLWLGEIFISRDKLRVFYFVIIIGSQLREKDALPRIQCLIDVPLNHGKRVKFQHPVFIFSKIGMLNFVI